MNTIDCMDDIYFLFHKLNLSQIICVIYVFDSMIGWLKVLEKGIL